MDNQIFTDMGLTVVETKIYLALLKTGTTTAGLILKETGLQNSTFHKTVHKLVAKGFVSFVIRSKTRYYTAADPETLLKFLKERESAFELLMPQLKLLQKPIDKQCAQVYEGFKGLKTMLNELIEDGDSGDEYLFFSFYTNNPDDFDSVYNYYAEFEKERKKKGLIVKGIAPRSVKDKFKGRAINNIRFVDFPVPLNMSVFKNKVIFTPWEEKQVSFLIYSKQLADSFRTYFYSIYGK